MTIAKELPLLHAIGVGVGDGVGVCVTVGLLVGAEPPPDPRSPPHPASASIAAKMHAAIRGGAALRPNLFRMRRENEPSWNRAGNEADARLSKRACGIRLPNPPSRSGLSEPIRGAEIAEPECSLNRAGELPGFYRNFTYLNLAV